MIQLKYSARIRDNFIFSKKLTWKRNLSIETISCIFMYRQICQQTEFFAAITEKVTNRISERVYASYILKYRFRANPKPNPKPDPKSDP